MPGFLHRILCKEVLGVNRSVAWNIMPENSAFRKNCRFKNGILRDAGFSYIFSSVKGLQTRIIEMYMLQGNRFQIKGGAGRKGNFCQHYMKKSLMRKAVSFVYEYHDT